ncbi:hypothetical protein CLV56_1050 [Mumia flava]|uniref:ABC-2 family transporter n=1 Tax=Mumia flava TaxID=1348852 RepID=A0A0B2BKH5_9ACTN|nr:hypothetical protein [Mumia flava]PJJ56837.1 hypothetical protein CLV56_1050 [Mumia flava]
MSDQLRKVLGIVVGIAAVQALFLLAFAWPAAESGPREVPIAVAGPAEAAAPVADRLAAVPGRDDGTSAFDVRTVDDAAAARSAIEDRDVLAAVVVSPDGPEVLVASAASPAVAQAMRSTAAELSDQSSTVPVTDVVPTPSGDPTGAGLAAGTLPLVLTSALGGIAVFAFLHTRAARLAAVGGIALTCGVVAPLVLTAIGVLDGGLVATTGVVALLVGSVTATVAGLGAVLGRPGAGLGVLMLVLVANPLSGAATAPQMVPQPWGELGQLMPVGAGVAAVRSAAFFDGAGSAGALVVLATWLIAGLALLTLGRSGLSVRAQSTSAATRSTASVSTPADVA